MSKTMQRDQIWWQGLVYWYNEQDYLQAMDVWSEALLELKGCEGNDLDTIHTDEERDVDTTFLKALIPREQKHASVDAVENWGDLLLFMAGCCLDAKQYQRCREYLIQALSLSQGRRLNSDMINEIVQEYLACIQEEYDDDSARPHFSKPPWVRAHSIVSQVLASPHLADCQWTSPYQRAGYLIPNLISLPWIPRDRHPPWCRILEDNWCMILQDFHQVFAGSPWPRVGEGEHRDDAGSHDGSVVTPGGNWREHVLFGSGSNHRESANAVCSFTKQLLRQHVPDAVSLAEAGGGEVIFSVLFPGTHVLPHCGSTNLRYTAHLGLVIPTSVPSDCGLRVADRAPVAWEEGRVLVFDDSFEHEVWNHAVSGYRAVLLIRYWHPSLASGSSSCLSERQQACLDQVMEAKSRDEMRRYNPPLPIEKPMCNTDTSHGASQTCAIRSRGLKQSTCPRCWQNGHQSLRVLLKERRFVCVCGTGIS
jgi:aspartyl/asparaginyl beta-hydroxylase (cupin superfamily)